jgi:hypothetical protein
MLITTGVALTLALCRRARFALHECLGLATVELDID